MTRIYVFVDDYLKEHPAQAAWRRSNNDAPAFTDAEVVTLGLLQGAFGCATLKKTYQLAAANWHPAFPRLCSYAATASGSPACTPWRLWSASSFRRPWDYAVWQAAST